MPEVPDSRHRYRGPGFLILAAILVAGGLRPAAAGAACLLSEDEAVPAIVLPLRQEVRHDHRRYFADLIQLALDKTEPEYGPCSVRLSRESMPQARLYQDLAHQRHVHIIDATAMPERDQRFRAIKFPLLKGLMGYRVAFIRTEDRDAFRQVKTLDDLSHFRAGQGDGWFDVQVLRRHGIPVTTTTKYESLYRMLRAGRFDFFPRGVQEIASEAGAFDTRGLSVQSTWALAYPWPVYFYVNREHALLAERVETGLFRAQADGSYDAFFYNHPLIVDALEQLDLPNRTVLYLCNPQHDNPDLLKRDPFWIHPWPEGLCAP